MSDKAIKVDKIGKKYKLGVKKSSDLRETIYNLMSHFYGTKDLKSQSNPTSTFWALKDISFDVNKGEALGIIGRNGAGKSTLLKILSRITKPTEGKFEINGRISTLLEVGTGFHPELSGRENIYLNGTILGMKRKEIKRKFEEIVAFSGVKSFIDTPVKHYSSGMQVRLAFSVAAHLEPEILIIDEVLAVGDAEFQKQCLGKMEDVTSSGRTVLFVSHNMGAVRALCRRALLIDNGLIKCIDTTDKVVENYLSAGDLQNSYYVSNSKKEIFIDKISILNHMFTNSSRHDFDKVIYIEWHCEINRDYQGLTLGLSVKNKKDTVVFTSDFLLTKSVAKNKIVKIRARIPKRVLLPGKYTIDTALHLPNREIFDKVFDKVIFYVIDSGTELSKYNVDLGCVYIPLEWSTF